MHPPAMQEVISFSPLSLGLTSRTGETAFSLALLPLSSSIKPDDFLTCYTIQTIRLIQCKLHKPFSCIHIVGLFSPSYFISMELQHKHLVHQVELFFLPLRWNPTEMVCQAFPSPAKAPGGKLNLSMDSAGRIFI